MSQDSLKISEVSTIRNILMGEQMAKYETQFAYLEEKILALEQQLSEEKAVLRKEQETSEITLKQQIADLEKLVMENVGRLDAKLMKSSKEDKAKISRLLQDLGSQLIDE